MQKVMVCLACDRALTRPLVLLSGKDPAVRAPEHKDRQPLTDPGQAFKSYQPIERSYGPEPAHLEFTPQYWLNPADLTNAVRLTSNRHRLGGCCGLAGSDGPNQLCACGAEVGTLRTDCWTPLVFVPVPTATSWQDHQ